MDRLEKALEKSKEQRAALEPDAASLAGDPENPGPPINEYQMDTNRIIAYRSRSAEADVYRQLRTKIFQIMRDNGYKTLAITSPNYGDGKTTVALNLGISLTLGIRRQVLVVDLDLRKPNLHQYMGLEARSGLADHLLYDVPIDECMIHPPFNRLTLLPVGVKLENSSELLTSAKMVALAQDLKSRFLVIYDMPPVLAQDDPIAFLPQVDAVLVVVRDGVTKIENLKRCLATLKKYNVIGTVLNNCW
jgi:Mrp family chromosome partitioning ATPase